MTLGVDAAILADDYTTIMTTQRERERELRVTFISDAMYSVLIVLV